MLTSSCRILDGVDHCCVDCDLATHAEVYRTIIGIVVDLFLCLYYSCLPHYSSMITDFIVPLIKCKSGDFSEHNNDRPMTLASIVSKV